MPNTYTLEPGILYKNSGKIPYLPDVALWQPLYRALCGGTPGQMADGGKQTGTLQASKAVGSALFMLTGHCIAIVQEPIKTKQHEQSFQRT